MNAQLNSINSIIDLQQVAQSFAELPHQAKALQWYDASIGISKKLTFAGIWRNDSNNTKPIELLRVCRYFENLEHQNKALDWLEDNTDEKILKEFARLWRVAPPTLPKSIKLSVPYFPQTDNYRDPNRTCNSSACAMCLKYFKPNAIANDNEYVKKVFALGDTTDHSIQTKVLADYGIKSCFSYTLDFEDLDRELNEKNPVVIGILHRGSLQAPTGGHMIVVIGKTEHGDYICHDPFGSLLDNYTTDVYNGREVVYPRHILNHRWLPDGPRTGWGRLFDVSSSSGSGNESATVIQTGNAVVDPSRALFQKALTFTLKWEGGKVDNPHDPGGRTNMGITQATYERYLRRQKRVIKDVYNITEAEVAEIYKIDYWNPARCQQMTPALAISMFDTCVNFGVGGAVMFLQEALKLPEPDGILGPNTLTAMMANNSTETATKLCQGRITYRHQRVKESPSQQVFLQGWLNRDQALLKFIKEL
jgi:Glycosyl hydrolase 108/Peptidase_C39 like family/Predicted Peptidoglycan domain